ncbi:MAG: hypothetical protein HOM58_03600 [Rhodospirillaceae bacterium]|jgi:hypothetical protein|nr:hypothetical protein [Rhodospirillaceae bacterium]
MKAFEIHTFQDGRWKIDSVFDDRELALFEARRVDEGTRYSGVRVIEELYDEASDLTTTKTIFRGGNRDRQERVLKAAAAQKTTSRAGHGTGRETGRKRPSRKQDKSTNYLIPILILAVLILAGLSAFLGLQQLSQLG